MNEWYKEKIEDVFKNLKTNENGLNEESINNRLKKYGYNELPTTKKDNILTILVREIKDPIVMILIITILFSFLIGEVVDACAIIFIVVVDIIMGTYQEWKALKNAEALSNMIKVKTRVIRDGKEQLIDSKYLVLGDIVLLESGDKVSADIRLFTCNNLQIDESALTGESVPILKNEKVLMKDTLLAERTNMVYAGTSVVTGRGKGIVVSTKDHTEIGKIANKVNETVEEKSPLTIRMEKFSKQISVLILMIAFIIAFVLFSKGEDVKVIFLSVIALSVSAMPEGLPLALTMALTIASNRMLKKNVIVKKLNAVESLGSCTVIASDKTGTLTVNEQTAKKILLPNDESYRIEGVGYNDSGKVLDLEHNPILYHLGKNGVLNNEAKLEKENGKWVYFGDSIDIAFLSLGKKMKMEKLNVSIIDQIPYESENQFSAVFYEEDKKTYCAVKGSLEKISSFCSTMGQDYTKIDFEKLKAQNESLARDGYRVIALASLEIEKKSSYKIEDIKNLNFDGMVGFIDPVRIEVKDSLKEAKDAGIKVVMITGDHPLTAFSIAKELELATSLEEVATGNEIEEALEKGEIYFDNFIACKRVFSRVTPIQKLEIVNSYKRQKEFVAVTGDGVNDAPALKTANIGIAMGSGTDVAKETASMIIRDDNFKSIVSGIKEGRNAYSNIRKVSYMLLSCGLAEVLFFLLAIIFNLPLPLVAIQLLWLNVVTDGLQDFALSFEKAEKGIMKEKPRSTKESLFNKELLLEVSISGLVIGFLVFGLWYYLINTLHFDVAVARGYVMALMVFIQNIHVLNCRSEKESTFHISFRSNPLILVAILSSIILQIIIMEVDVLSKYLQTVSIPVVDMLWLLSISCIILIIMEIYKKRFKKTR